MALVTRDADASIDTSTALHASQIPSLVAGEALDPAAPCFIKESDGLVYMSNGTADDEEAEVHGFTAKAYTVGAANVTLFGPGTRFHYGASLTPGDVFFVGATKGRLDTVATVGDSRGVALVVSANDILFLRYKTSAAA